MRRKLEKNNLGMFDVDSLFQRVHSKQQIFIYKKIVIWNSSYQFPGYILMETFDV